MGTLGKQMYTVEMPAVTKWDWGPLLQNLLLSITTPRNETLPQALYLSVGTCSRSLILRRASTHLRTAGDEAV